MLYNKNTPQQNVEAFWKRVDKRGRNQCWPWIGWIRKDGYGTFYCGGQNRSDGKRGRYYLPHRFSYELHRGKIPKGKLVCHKCDNRRCCNPRHFFVGTHKDNTDDSIKKKRFRLPMTRLSDSQVEEIRRRYTRSRGVGKLANEFGITIGHLWALTHGKSRTTPGKFLGAKT